MKNKGNIMNVDIIMLRVIQIVLIYLESEMQNSTHRQSENETKVSHKNVQKKLLLLSMSDILFLLTQIIIDKLAHVKDQRKVARSFQNKI